MDRKSHLEAVPPPRMGILDSKTVEERRRRPRIGLTSEQFRFGQNGKVFSVSDLSPDGMAIRVLDRNDFALFPVATTLSGTLNLRGMRYSIQARVRRIGHELIGCEFQSLEASVQEALEKFLDPKVLGSELRPIPSSETGTLWYHGPSGTDLLLVRGADGQYRRMTLFVLGNYILWEGDSGLSTGSAVDATEGVPPGEVWGIVRFETMVLESDKTPDSNKLNIAKALILSSNLPQDLKKWCVRQLEFS